jgi:hypothetical protein
MGAYEAGRTEGGDSAASVAELRAGSFPYASQPADG